jgi:hypothetical protein
MHDYMNVVIFTMNTEDLISKTFCTISQQNSIYNASYPTFY